MRSLVTLFLGLVVLSQNYSAAQDQVLSVSPQGCVIQKNGKQKAIPFNNQLLLIVEAGAESELISEGQIVDVKGMWDRKVLKSESVKIHTQPNLTTEKTLISAAGSKITKPDQAIPVHITGRVVSTEPLRVQSLGYLRNSYLVPAVPNGPPTVSQYLDFKGEIFTVESKKVRVLIVNDPSLLKVGMTVKSADTRRGKFVLRVSSKKRFSREELKKE